MERVARRQAVAAILVLFLAVTVSRVAWTRARMALVEAELNDARQWLEGRVVLIDPGHGGDDPGAVVNGTREKDLVLNISLILRQMLEQKGAVVHLTRETDRSLGGSTREELGRRVALSRRYKSYVYVSIHANHDSCRCWGAQTFFQKGETRGGKALATAIQNQLRRLTPTTRVPLAGDYFVLRNSSIPAVIVEVGFLTHGPEHNRLLNPEYQQTLAKAITLGLADYFRSRVPEGKADASIGD